jgi:hypothetical protein
MTDSKQHSGNASRDTRSSSGRTGDLVAPTSAAARLVPVSAKVDSRLSDEIDEYAKARGITRSRAASQYLTIASEALRGRDGIAAGKAEEILEALEGVRAVVELLGPPAFGVMRLLSHWATQTGGLRVSEDELLAELRTVAADEWEQVLSDAERELHEAIRKARSEGGK